MTRTLFTYIFIAVTSEYLVLAACDTLQGNLCEVFNASKPLNFTELAEKYGFQAEEYAVTTEDGYILGLFRIPGNHGLPILLLHGLGDSSDTWLIRGDISLGIALARKNYDVWFGNVRGNKYSRRHLTLNPDKDASFWDFSFHDHGFYDVPAMIDPILRNTGYKNLNVFGHSQGNMVFFIMGSTRPEYNEKINVMAALAPICFLNNVHSPISLLAQMAPEISKFAEGIDMNEFFGNTPSGKLVQVICNNRKDGYSVCAMGFAFPVAGFDVEEFPSSFFYEVIPYYPDSISRKNLVHFSQLIVRGRFSQFDYGVEGNLREYNSIEPPDYDLGKVKMPVILLAGRNDKLSVLADIETLKAGLPNVVKYIIDERKLMNHIDHVWGEHMSEYLFSHIFDILEEYN